MRLTTNLLLICLILVFAGCARYSVVITEPDGTSKSLKVFSWRKFPEGASINYGETGFQFGTPRVEAGGEIEALRDIILGRPVGDDED